MAEPEKDPFEIVLKDGCTFTVRPHIGHRLKVTYVALQDGKNATVYVNGKVMAKIHEAGHGMKVAMVGKEAVLGVRGGKVVIFMHWELYDKAALYGDYETSDDEDLPTLGDKTFTWASDPRFLGKKRKRESPPRLIQVEDGEPPARIDVTPPRMLSLVPSSSPERSASRSEDEGGYFVKVPSASPILPTVKRMAFKRPKPEQVPVLDTPPPPPAPRPSPKKEDSPKQVRIVPNGAVPRGVLKKRSRLLRLMPSPKMSPKAPPGTPKNRKVLFNTRSPDIRFISPPLSAIHKAFAGGLLDLGVPLLTQNVKPSRSIVSQTPQVQHDIKPRPTAHQPHLLPMVTPPAYRPTVIE